MKLHAFLSIALILFVAKGYAQEHYRPVGNFTDAMNINLLEAKVNGIDLEKGDEIGIFSGDLCVGHAVLVESLEGVFDAKTKSAVAGADDAETAAIDGFSSGGTITFKFWDISEQLELSVDNITYYNPNNGNVIEARTFAIGATAYVTLNTTYNYKPNADAGPDQILHEGESGQLDGNGSEDLNGDSLSYSWIDLDTFGLETPDVASPGFTAPKVDSDKDFRFVLVVSDGVNSSEPDTTIITILNVASGPVANAGGELIEVNELDPVVLDGSLSFDPDGESISWHWELSDNSIDLVNGTSASTSFIVPEVASDTSFYAVLTVTNSSGFSDSDTIQIKILNVNKAPVAVVTHKNFVIHEGDSIVLDGSNSYDPDNGLDQLSYQWINLNGGELSHVNTMNAVFIAPWLLSDSTFLVTLNIFDGESYSSPDTVSITVLHKNLPPVANAGENITINEGDEIVLNGKSSFDPEGKFLLYEWSSDYLILDDVYASDPLFMAVELQRDTTVFVTLKVSDKELWSEPDTLWIIIQNVNKSPEWISLPQDTAYLGRTYQGLVEVSDADIHDTIRFSFPDLPLWLNFIDHGDGTAELIADTVPYIDAFQGNWEIMVQASDGTVTIDTTIVLFVTFYTDISQLDLSGFNVFPNPASDRLNFQFANDTQKNRLIRFYSSSGILVKQESITKRKSQIDISSFSKGIYYLEVMEDGQSISGQKLIIN